MTPMQEQDFTLVAETIKDLRGGVDNDSLDAIAWALAQTFKDAYYQVFRVDDFLRRCGVEGHTPEGYLPPQKS